MPQQVAPGRSQTADADRGRVRSGIRLGGIDIAAGEASGQELGEELGLAFSAPDEGRILIDREGDVRLAHAPVWLVSMRSRAEVPAWPATNRRTSLIHQSLTCYGGGRNGSRAKTGSDW
jgi:hypothetical protein